MAIKESVKNLWPLVEKKKEEKQNVSFFKIALYFKSSCVQGCHIFVSLRNGKTFLHCLKQTQNKLLPGKRKKAEHCTPVISLLKCLSSQIDSTYNVFDPLNDVKPCFDRYIFRRTIQKKGLLNKDKSV